MKATNNTDKKMIQLEVSYTESHHLAEALFNYQLYMKSKYGENSEEEREIGELLHTLRNPIIEKREEN